MIVAAEPALAPPASAMTNGRGSRPRRTSPAHSIGVIANTTTSLASTAERIARGDDRDRQQRRGRQGGGRDPHRAPVVEPAGGELGGQDHQPEQDDQRREVDRGQHRCAIQRAAAVEQDRAQERDAGAVDLEPRPAADRHAEVDRREDDEDEAGQADAIMAAAGAPSGRSPPMRSCRRRGPALRMGRRTAVKLLKDRRRRPRPRASPTR